MTRDDLKAIADAVSPVIKDYVARELNNRDATHSLVKLTVDDVAAAVDEALARETKELRKKIAALRWDLSVIEQKVGIKPRVRVPALRRVV